MSIYSKNFNTLEQDLQDRITQIPSVRGKIIDGLVVVDCPFCGKKHYHGGALNLGESLKGHVLADCGRGGYVIRILKVGDK